MKSIVYVSLLTLSGLGKYLPVLGDGGERVRDHANRLPQEQVEEERLLEMYAVNNATAVEITSKMLSFTVRGSSPNRGAQPCHEIRGTGSDDGLTLSDPRPRPRRNMSPTSRFSFRRGRI